MQKDNAIKLSVSYAVKESTGCPHRLSGCRLFCDTCGQYFGCQRCHTQYLLDQMMDDHKMAVSKLQCVHCSKDVFTNDL